MHSAIVLLSLGLAVAVASGSLADHAESITSRNMATDRAERVAAAFVGSCSSEGCDPSIVNTARLDGTVLAGCVNQAEGGSILEVNARIPWNPRVFTDLTPARGMVAIELGGFSVPAAAVLKSC